MKILHVSDLHGHKDWYAWLAQYAREHPPGTSHGIDLTVITGDLIDALAPKPHPGRHAALAEATVEAIRASGMPVLICSGNHDRGLTFTSWPWLYRQENKTTRLPGANVTSLAYDTLSFYTLVDLQRAGRPKGSTLPWIVLQHVPPAQSRTLGDRTPDGTSCLLPFAPDFLLSGHIHQAPWTGGSWIDKIQFKHLPNPTVCLNPGSIWDQDIPYHIILDTEAHTASWFTTPSAPPISIDYARMPIAEYQG